MLSKQNSQYLQFSNNVTIAKAVLNKKRSPQSGFRTFVLLLLPFCYACACIFLLNCNFNMCSFLHFVFKDKWTLLSTNYLSRLEDTPMCDTECRLAGLLLWAWGWLKQHLPGVWVTEFGSGNGPWWRTTSLCLGSPLQNFMNDWQNARVLALKSTDDLKRDNHYR